MPPLTPTSSQEVIEVHDSSPDPAEKRRRAILAAFEEPDKGKRKADDENSEGVFAEQLLAGKEAKRTKHSLVSRSRETERMVGA